MNIKRTLAAAAALTAFAAFAACGDVEDENIYAPNESQGSLDASSDGGSDSSEEASETSEASSQDESSQISDGADESLSESEETSGGDLSSETDESGTVSDDSEVSEETLYYKNSEFYFELPLPDGTEYKEYDTELIPTDSDPDVNFRILMETVYNGKFSMTAQLYETSETFDDFVKAKWDMDETNAPGSGMTILDTAQTTSADGAPIQIITGVTSGGTDDIEDFYTLYAYVELSDGQYIYVQGDCRDDDTLQTLRECAEGIRFFN